MGTFPKWLAYLVAVCAVLITASILWSQRYVPLATRPLYLDRWTGTVCSPSSCYPKPATPERDPLVEYRDSVARAKATH